MYNEKEMCKITEEKERAVCEMPKKRANAFFGILLLSAFWEFAIIFRLQ